MNRRVVYPDHVAASSDHLSVSSTEWTVSFAIENRYGGDDNGPVVAYCTLTREVFEQLVRDHAAQAGEGER